VVPIIRGESERKEDNTALCLSKGQKRGVQKVATLSLSSEFKSRSRNAEEIIDLLFSILEYPRSIKEQEPHLLRENKHVSEFLTD
jgi:hypothetical protein